MRRRTLPTIVTAAIALLTTAAIAFGATAPQTFLQLGVRGPAGQSKLAPATPTPMSRYATADNPSVLSLYVTEDGSDWLSLAHGLEALGVPFSVTSDPAVALQHRVIMAYPYVSGRNVSEGTIAALDTWIRSGGTLIGQNVLGGMTEVFGFGAPVESRARVSVTFGCATTAPCSFSQPEERTVPIGSAKLAEGILGSVGYTQLAADTQTLASFNDGTAAVTMRQVGAGRAIALGIDVGQLTRQGQTQRSVGIQRSPGNQYRPTIDVWLRLIEGAYRMGNPTAVTLAPTQHGKELSVMLTHDVDFYPSFRNSLAFAKAERAAKTPATFFTQAKYTKDFNDIPYLTRENIRYFQAIRRMPGMEIASHTVSHADAFRKFVSGTGREAYPTYNPVVKSLAVTKGGTVFGEARVSKYLLERLIGGPKVTSFRSGYLKNPVSLTQVLQSTGYQTSSTNMANESLTHLGYRANAARAGRSESNVYEVPITIEDQLPPAMPKRVGAAIKVANQLRAYRGSYVVLIHPSITGYKLAFQKRVVAGIRSFSNFTTVRDYGAFLRARGAVRVSTTQEGTETVVTLAIPQPVKGLTFRPPSGLRLTGAVGANATQNADGYVVLNGTAKGTVTARFTA